MKLKIKITVMMFFCYTIIFGQKDCSSISPDTCSSIFSSISYFWKLDSSGVNGFRLKAHEEIVKCQKIKISADCLIKVLGEPNKISKYYDGRFDYIYYYYDGSKLPKEAGLAYELGYIAFNFNQKEKYLVSIGTGHMD